MANARNTARPSPHPLLSDLPSDDENGGHPRHHDPHDDAPVSYPEFTRLLLVKKNEILARNQDARHNLDQQVADSPGDEADASVIDTSADYFLKLANNLQDELREIDAAFERMNRNVYGTCESCEEDIGSARLRKLPEARLCIDCQSLVERNHAAAFPRARPKL